MLINSERLGIWKEAVAANMKVILQYWQREAEENYENMPE
jgi:hypothetical protein